MLGLQADPKPLPSIAVAMFWAPIGIFLSLLLVLASPKLLSSVSWGLFVSILSSQAGPPTFKNLGFMKAGARFSKNQGLGSKDALDGVLGLSWARFGCSWAPYTCISLIDSSIEAVL